MGHSARVSRLMAMEKWVIDRKKAGKRVGYADILAKYTKEMPYFTRATVVDYAKSTVRNLIMRGVSL